MLYIFNEAGFWYCVRLFQSSPKNAQEKVLVEASLYF